EFNYFKKIVNIDFEYSDMEKLLPNSIFINYRSKNNTDFARDLEKFLKGEFWDKAIFRDETSIRLNTLWEDFIVNVLKSTNVMLCIIGPEWAASFDNEYENEDWVRKEIVYALDECIDIIPILFGISKLPNEKSLPSTFPKKLLPLLKKQGFVIKNNQKEERMGLLALSLKYLLEREESQKEQNISFPKFDFLKTLPLPQNPYQKYARQLESPFLGSDFYKETEARIFFGRNREIRTLFHLVRRSRLVCLHGNSGSGKSSLLYAGLIPRMKQLFNWTVLKPLRRNKLAGGFYRQLQELEYSQLEELASVQKLEEDSKAHHSNPKILLIVDQVEEMYTDPLATESLEIIPFGKKLSYFSNKIPNLHILFSYRSTYAKKINVDFIDANGLFLDTLEMSLDGVSEKGLMDCMQRPLEMSEGFLFNLDIPTNISTSVAQTIANDFAKDSVFFQILMQDLWKVSIMDEKSVKRRIISDPTYEFNKNRGAESYLKKCLSDLESLYCDSWGALITKGLGIDILYGFTWEDGTNKEVKVEEFFMAYDHLFNCVDNGNPSSEILNAFRKIYLLTEESSKGESQLGHESLGPIIRRLFLKSNLPAQRAKRIIELRKREIDQGFKNVMFSETDIQVIEEGRNAMSAIPEEIENMINRDKQTYGSIRDVFKNFLKMIIRE
ncbi:MAG: toll/interleukin-1 receptor domain-containing protein, partial [Bacteroidota bacterium]